jgi:hypothetical protein
MKQNKVNTTIEWTKQNSILVWILKIKKKNICYKEEKRKIELYKEEIFFAILGGPNLPWRHPTKGTTFVTWPFNHAPS